MFDQEDPHRADKLYILSRVAQIVDKMCDDKALRHKIAAINLPHAESLHAEEEYTED